MTHIVQKLRQKPQKVRERILIGSLVVAIPIVLLLAALIGNLFPGKDKETASTVGIFQSMIKSTFSQKPPLND